MLPKQSPWSVLRRSQSLILLCLVQGCERFAFLAMLPLFVLYAREQHAISAPTALLILAVFQALSYLGGLPAGWLADRKLGMRASTLLGATLLAGGYGGLALGPAELLWPALGMMVAGHSLFKPGLHVLIANVADGHKPSRGFLWQYLAVNLGHAAGALFGEWSHARVGWTGLFGGACAASAIGVVLLVFGMPWLRAEARSGSEGAALASSPYTSERMRAVWLLCAVAVVFWLTAQQAGSSLTVFAAMNTAQQVTVHGHAFQLGPGHFASLHGLMVLALLPAFLAVQGRQASAPSTAGKLLWGYVATSAAFVLMAAAGLSGGDSGRVSGGWLASCYLLLSLAEVLLAPLSVSLITQLAPKTKAAQAVGLWFAGSAMGHGLAGVLGLCWDRWPHHRYFGLLALLSLGAAAVLLPRLRQLDWLTALCTSASPQPVVEKRMAPMTTDQNPTTDDLASTSAMPHRAPSRATLILTSLAILLPSMVAAMKYLPLPVRGIGAILGGLAVLLGGPYLFSHALVRWARRDAGHASEGDAITANR